MEKRYQTQTVPSYARGSHKAQRSVPPLVTLSVLFNNIFGYLGLSFGGMGMIFAIVFTPMIDFTSPFYFGESVVNTTGVVTEVNSTNVEVNENAVLEYKFTFEYMGKAYRGVSYSTEHNYTADQNVPVEFEPGDPSIARIEDMSLKPVGLFLLFIYIFPAIGFTFLFFCFKKGIPKIRAIQYGVMTRGKFIKKVSTGGSINDEPVMNLYFSFKDVMGNEYTAIGTTHKTALVEDEPEERIIYDPADPSNAVVVDAMPSNVRKYLSNIPG
ncbi:MAG TPA: hypothetical protein PKZ64_15920 [Spirochaetota bacterium]|nr:hypothetical protein [Spirochaetota bacterium]